MANRLLRIPFLDKVLMRIKESNETNPKINTKRVILPKAIEITEDSAKESKRHTTNTPGLSIAPILNTGSQAKP